MNSINIFDCIRAKFQFHVHILTFTFFLIRQWKINWCLYLLFSLDLEEGHEDDRETRHNCRQLQGYRVRYLSISKKVREFWSLNFFLKTFNYTIMIFLNVLTISLRNCIRSSNLYSLHDADIAKYSANIIDYYVRKKN